ncbi:MAG: S41 family peptidase, partial [Bacteroidales bacterium]|nr:S41 family peptidase [Bacteroidales bacterium]
MKKFLKLTFLIFSIFCFNNNVFAQLSAETFKELYVQNMLKTIIQSSHYNPPEIDDSLSLNTYNAYLKAVDNYKRFFTAADIKKLDAYKWQLDDEYNGDNMAFFDMSYGIISKRVTEAERYYIEATAEPFSFTSDDFVQMNPDSLKWAKDTTELLKRWYQMLKYETLVKIYNDNKAQEEKNGTTPKKTFSELEVTARESIRKRYKNWFDIMLKEDKTDYFDDYMNALLWSCDPHTNFFSPKDKEDFDIRFSGQLEGIGATLTLKDGYVTVTDIVPGSPSWKQGELEVNDKILKVAQGNLEAVDIVDMRLDKAVKLIRGPKGSEVRLTIQKINGTQKVISITRDVVIIEATYAKSMVITDKDNGKRIGYIYIPSFYANFNDAAGRRCSNDLKEELQKLKAENISGLIIDLRNNTGGSLTDCIDMAGMFIDIGPIVQVKSPAKALSYPDRYSGEIWDGPLVVMINQYSASASEIFAAALQDYKRAIIFGTTSYGKGTVQKFIDLDNLASDKLNSYKPLGSVKVTLQKFYRINGGSTQLIGV